MRLNQIWKRRYYSTKSSYYFIRFKHQAIYGVIRIKLVDFDIPLEF